MNYALSLFIYELGAEDLDRIDRELQRLFLFRQGAPQELKSPQPDLGSPTVVHTIVEDRSGLPLVDLRRALLSLSQSEMPAVDFILQDLAAARTPKRLAVFDMDSTLIRAEVIDEYGRELGIYDPISAITASTMRGEIDFNESFRRRMALLKNLPEDRARGIWDRIELTPGTEFLFRELKHRGIRTALVSGGFTHIAQNVQKLLGIDTVACNEMRFENGFCTGEVVPPIMNAEEKARELEELRKSGGLKVEETLAVGDGANDIPMLLKAGLGIAVHAKPKVIEAVGVSLRSSSLSPLIHILQFPL